jgi:hypothetical protein
LSVVYAEALALLADELAEDMPPSIATAAGNEVEQP